MRVLRFFQWHGSHHGVSLANVAATVAEFERFISFGPILSRRVACATHVVCVLLSWMNSQMFSTHGSPKFEVLHNTLHTFRTMLVRSLKLFQLRYDVTTAYHSPTWLQRLRSLGVFSHGSIWSLASSHVPNSSGQFIQ